MSDPKNGFQLIFIMDKLQISKFVSASHFIDPVFDPTKFFFVICKKNAVESMYSDHNW